MSPVEYAGGKRSLWAYIAVCFQIHYNLSSSVYESRQEEISRQFLVGVSAWSCLSCFDSVGWVTKKGNRSVKRNLLQLSQRFCFGDMAQHMIQSNIVYLRALKSWRDGTETKNKEKLKTKTRVTRKKQSEQKVHQGSPGGRTENTGGRICETGRF